MYKKINTGLEAFHFQGSVGIILKLQDEEVVDYRPVRFCHQYNSNDPYHHTPHTFWNASLEKCEYFEKLGQPLTLNQKKELVKIYNAVEKRAEVEDVHNW